MHISDIFIFDPISSSFAFFIRFSVSSVVNETPEVLLMSELKYGTEQPSSSDSELSVRFGSANLFSTADRAMSASLSVVFLRWASIYRFAFKTISPMPT